MSPQRVMIGTRSTGTALLFWAAGMIYCMCGVHVYIEYGLNVPRYIINGIEQSVLAAVVTSTICPMSTTSRRIARTPSSYRLAYSESPSSSSGIWPETVWSLLTVCSSAANLREPSNAAVRGVALAVATFSCFIHTVSRRGGIWLNNTLAMVKLGFLLLIVIITICVAARSLPETPNVIEDNTALDKSFAKGSNDANGYAQAFLAIIFSFSGFEQPNYVLGEISRPRRKFPIAMSAGVGIVITMYLAVNICYVSP